MAFTARYHGECEYCDERIEPGDDVMYEQGDLIHTDCSIELAEAEDEDEDF